MSTRFHRVPDAEAEPDAIRPSPTTTKICARDPGKPTKTMNSASASAHAITQRKRHTRRRGMPTASSAARVGTSIPPSGVVTWASGSSCIPCEPTPIRPGAAGLQGHGCRPCRRRVPRAVPPIGRRADCPPRRPRRRRPSRGARLTHSARRGTRATQPWRWDTAPATTANARCDDQKNNAMSRAVAAWSDGTAATLFTYCCEPMTRERSTPSDARAAWA